MPDPALLKKRRLLTDQRALVLNSPTGYLDRLTPPPDSVILDPEPAAGVSYDFVQVFVRNSGELAHWLPIARQTARYDGILWVCYPKLSAKVLSDLSRDRLWDLTKPTGLAPVTQIALDDTWSALRFRPAERVGAGKA
ncbi:MAG: hypothetical protein K1X65_14940 [Caldilineales bacterium]|nr:hypothetical protein [Caldilineales bacterium]MCW5856990.1 hypothetical protein [Caldilineales bacterium]